MDPLRGRTALITGAGGGIGRYIARALAAAGMDLVLSDTPATPMETLIAEVEALGSRAAAVPVDLADPKRAEALIASAGQALAPVDVLVNNAGIDGTGSFLRMTTDEIDEIVRVNLVATMVLTRAALPGMRERGYGHVVNLASIAGKLPSPYLSTYSATKHAIVGFTQSLLAELGPEPVGFSAVCPGFVSDVGMLGRLQTELPEPPYALATVPPDRVADAVVEAIRRNRPEVIVARRPVRPVALLSAVAPRTASRLMGHPRLADFAREVARARDRL